MAAEANLELVSEGRSTAMTYLYPSAGVEVMQVMQKQPDGATRQAMQVASAYMVQPAWALLISLLQWKTVSEWASDYDAREGLHPRSLGKLRVCVRSTVDPLEDNTEFEFGRLVLIREPLGGELFTNAESSGGALGNALRDIALIGGTKRTQRRATAAWSFRAAVRRCLRRTPTD